MRREFISKLRTLDPLVSLEASVGIATKENWKAAFDAMDPAVFSELSRDGFKEILERDVESKAEPPGWIALDRYNVSDLAKRIHEIMTGRSQADAADGVAGNPVAGDAVADELNGDEPTVTPAVRSAMAEKKFEVRVVV